MSLSLLSGLDFGTRIFIQDVSVALSNKNDLPSVSSFAVRPRLHGRVVLFGTVDISSNYFFLYCISNFAPHFIL